VLTLLFETDPVTRRAKVHAQVHYRWYLQGLTREYELRAEGRDRLAFDVRREAQAHRERALDACWILTGKWREVE